MNTIDDFLSLIESELGLHLTSQQAAQSFDKLSGWDSVHLLALVGAIERTTGRSLSLARVLEAANLEDVYVLAAEA